MGKEQNSVKGSCWHVASAMVEGAREAHFLGTTVIVATIAEELLDPASRLLLDGQDVRGKKLPMASAAQISLSLAVNSANTTVKPRLPRTNLKEVPSILSKFLLQSYNETKSLLPLSIQSASLEALP